MGHGHHHSHGASAEVPFAPEDVPAVLDTSIPDSELSPDEVSRRGFLRGAGLLGAGAAAGGVLAHAGTASADPGGGHRGGDDRGGTGGLRWLAGDHHIHTQYSSDAVYRVIDHAQHAAAYGLDWMVVTDHGSVAHAKIGVEKVNPNIVAAREELPRMLIFQGLEWNIPAAEHGTVFVTPGRNEVAVLKEFENAYDGSVTNTSGSSPANEAHAIAGLNFLAEAVKRRRVEHALFLANHPARRGVDSPHEFRGWRDAAPGIAVGMEGAPGHQAAGIPKPHGPGSAAGFGYRAVMDGIRAGRIWVDHGGLVRHLDLRVNRSTTLGGTVTVRRGSTVELTIEIDLATTPNWAQFVPVLTRVDVIAGPWGDLWFYANPIWVLPR